MVSGITSTPPDMRRMAAREAAEPNEAAEAAHARNAERKEAADPGDRVTLGSAMRAGAAYGKPAPGEASFSARLMVLQELVSKVFGKQGLSTTIDVGEGRTAKLEDLTPDQAADLVSEDGYWGVEKTSQRIADFAIHAAGSDPSKLDAIKESVLKGYGMAEKGFGGSLPDISKKTLDAVMAKLDDWAKSQAGDGPAPDEPPPAA